MPHDDPQTQALNRVADELHATHKSIDRATRQREGFLSEESVELLNKTLASFRRIARRLGRIDDRTP